ncbi:hypothetical protein [Gordonia aichiensis]|uniref:Uncharacterized protein n=1 Tax=Gordonia aichiensis NBRC 108223 TaxID=1220583 RepID=L7KG62_9ACTN|nr:hypothetical protein [Gordonia aichiensis]GAC47461.1 hypothetical protein GOACH_03_04820 [Gordonia aichiensis NBRC 108223]
MVFTAILIILLVVAVVAMIMRNRGQRIGGFGGNTAGYAQGLLTVTGVSEQAEPDSKGQMFCTISGTINGPGTHPTDVYGTMVLSDGEMWPQIGSEHAVVYKPGKAATTWGFGQLPPMQTPDAPPTT